MDRPPARRAPLGLIAGVTALVVAIAALAFAIGRLHASSSPSAGSPPTSSSTPPGSLPPVSPPPGGQVPLIVLHYNNGQKVLGSQEADLRVIRQVFNTVIIKNGNDKLLDEVHAAGLRVILGMDEVHPYVHGQDITPVVNSVIHEVKAHPGWIYGIRIGDRINKGDTQAQVLSYLNATGGLFHREIPGVKVFADVVDWQLGCDGPGLKACGTPASHLAQYRNADNSELTAIYHSGDLDGIMLALSLPKSVKGDQALDLRTRTAAWRQVRALVPRPFILLARVTSFSFPQSAFTGSAQKAAFMVHSEEAIPIANGANGIDAWAWRVVYRGQLKTMINKNGSTNVLWDTLQRQSAAYHAEAPAP